MDKDMEQIAIALKPLFDQMKSELQSEMRGGFDQVDKRMAGMAARIEARFDAVEEDVAVTKTVLGRVAADVAVLKQDVSMLKQDMAEVKGSLADQRDRSAFHAETLLEHDKRLRVLEGRQA